METGAPGEVTAILRDLKAGHSDAADRLVPLLMQELRTLARLHLRSERPGHTLQPTALVHEVYLRLVTDQARGWQNRAHFIGVSVSVMRRILVDHARRKRALKRDAGERVVADREDYAGFSHEQADELISLNMALDTLEKLSPRQRQMVELRYFGGLSLEETAEAMNVSAITVQRDWIAARAWLKQRLRPKTLPE